MLAGLPLGAGPRVGPQGLVNGSLEAEYGVDGAGQVGMNPSYKFELEPAHSVALTKGGVWFTPNGPPLITPSA
jgi:hypothetical protein